jgi:two-component system KDP operon response regulator KdpE
LPKWKILIIDDDPYLIVGLAPRLKANGYDVVTAPNAASAMAIARRELPDLIILDLRLPAVADGLLLLREIKSTAEVTKARVIVLSSAAAAESEKRVLDAGATAFLQKPPVNDELLAAIWQALAQVPGRVDGRQLELPGDDKQNSRSNDN